MGLFESIKNIMTIPAEDEDFEEEYVESEDSSKKKSVEEDNYSVRKENSPKILLFFNCCLCFIYLFIRVIKQNIKKFSH
jgi:hypothetical protein